MSMFPLIRAEDLGGAACADAGTTYSLGDVVVMRDASGEWILHRIVGQRISSDGFKFLLKGDAAFHSHLADPSDVYGRLQVLNGRPVRRSRLDRWIALLSRIHESENRFQRKVARSFVDLLGRWRRKFL